MTRFTDRFHMCGQVGDITDVGRLERISVVFGMLDEERKSVGWYQFVADGKPKSKREPAKHAHPKLMLHLYPWLSLFPRGVRFGYQIDGGVDIPFAVQKHIQLDGLAIHPKGTPATLTMEVGNERFRKIECRISHLKTKAKEVVTFPFFLQYGSDPSWPGPIHGRIKFLKITRFERDWFRLGPEFSH